MMRIWTCERVITMTIPATTPPIFIVSGGMGASGTHLVQTALAQFEQAQSTLHIISEIEQENQIEPVVRRAAAANGIIVHTLVDVHLREALVVLVELRAHERETGIDLRLQPVEAPVHLLKAPVHLLEAPVHQVELRAGLLAEGVDRLPVGVELETDIGEVTVVHGGEVPGDGGLLGDLLDPGLQPGDPDFVIGGLAHAGEGSDRRLRAGPAELRSSLSCRT